MSVSAISTSSVLQSCQPQAIKDRFAKVQSEFQQVGQDLQAGKLAQARSDFALLTQDLPSSLQNTSNPVGQAFNALGQALQAGDLSNAQRAYMTVQQDIRQAVGHGGHRHHRHAGGASSLLTGARVNTTA